MYVMGVLRGFNWCFIVMTDLWVLQECSMDVSLIFLDTFQTSSYHPAYTFWTFFGQNPNDIDPLIFKIGCGGLLQVNDNDGSSVALFRD